MKNRRTLSAMGIVLVLGLTFGVLWTLQSGSGATVVDAAQEPQVLDKARTTDLDHRRAEYAGAVSAARQCGLSSGQDVLDSAGAAARVEITEPALSPDSFEYSYAVEVVPANGVVLPPEAFALSSAVSDSVAACAERHSLGAEDAYQKAFLTDSASMTKLESKLDKCLVRAGISEQASDATVEGLKRGRDAATPQAAKAALDATLEPAIAGDSPDGKRAIGDCLKEVPALSAFLG